MNSPPLIGLAEMRKRTPPGLCHLCGAPAKPIRSKRSKRTHFNTCGAVECLETGYQRLYRRDYRRRELNS